MTMTSSSLRSTAALVVLCCIALSMGQQRQRTECCEEYCYGQDSDRPQTMRFASKSVYQIARGVDMNRHSVVPNCRPTKFWMMARHGARLPSAQDMQKLKTLIDLRDQIIENYEQRKSKPDVGYLCDADYQSIKNWRWDSNITGNFDQYLTVQGWNDEKFLAKQFQRILPNVMDTIYSADQYMFRHTPTQRTEASFRAFAEGLFGENAYMHIHPKQSAENDTLLKPQASCPIYKENKNRNKEPTSEWNKFVASDIFQDMMTEVSSRLGFRFKLTVAQIELIWDMCRYEQAWFIERLSPWCAAFTKSHVSILEYKEDLTYYYKAGYGNPVNEHIACNAMTDMLSHLKNRDGPKVVASFAHSTNIQLLVAAMGVLRDNVPPRSDNYNQMNRRQWRISRIDPFSANLVAISYDCDDVEKHKVMFFLNEKPLELDWCRVGLCDWSRVEEHYQKYLSGIDCEREFCQQSAAGQFSGSAFILSVLVFGVLFLRRV